MSDDLSSDVLNVINEEGKNGRLVNDSNPSCPNTEGHEQNDVFWSEIAKGFIYCHNYS